MIYTNKEELLTALSLANKGIERAKILQIEQNRNLIKSSGANVTLYSGEIKTSYSPLKALENVHIGVIRRLNAKTGEPDGIGALGGLSERTNEAEFTAMSPKQRRALIGKKDDVIMSDNDAVLTFDINIIRLNNVIRETNEELGNLGIYDFKINPYDMQLIDMAEVRDDNFAINIWNGKGDVWCITPYCHMLKTSQETLDMLEKRSKDVHQHEQNSEAANYTKIKLTHALKSFGNTSGKNKLEDGRNANTDYRYPHEWLASWALASKLLNNDEEKIINLYREIQSQTPWKISFNNAAKKMGTDLNFIAKTLKISPKAVEEMEKVSPPAISKNYFNSY